VDVGAGVRSDAPGWHATAELDADSSGCCRVRAADLVVRVEPPIGIEPMTYSLRGQSVASLISAHPHRSWVNGPHPSGGVQLRMAPLSLSQSPSLRLAKDGSAYSASECDRSKPRT
jgi:hypothetical protein